ncbi:MAG: VWA domain-containing protein [Acidobacteria bacterium]|nr:VWA domain-containing protein [Acidobacteriota bacterium]
MKPLPYPRRPKSVSVSRAALFMFLLAVAQAQTQAPPSSRSKEAPEHRFGTTTSLVTAPVTVLGPDNKYVPGLKKEDFKVFDNDQEQEIAGFDVSFLPISLVLCIQSSGRIEGLLSQIQKTGNLYPYLVLGEQGEAAVISFDSRVDVRQEFTKDPDKIIDAVKKIKAGSDATRMSDAVWRAIRLLRTRPENHRKVIIIVSETRDNGSETNLGEVMRDAQLSDIIIYGIRLSTLKGKATQPAQPKRDVFPPGVAARPTAPGVVSTPTSQAQSHVEVVNAIQFIIEAVRGVKNLLFNDPLQLLTDGTGGKMLAPLTTSSLEESVGKIGEELHRPTMA